MIAWGSAYYHDCKRYCLGSFLLLCLGQFPAMSSAQERPLWEAGIGMIAMHLPDYRGSENGRNYLLPYPYLIYRGDYLNIDEDGIRGLMYEDSAVTLDLSLAAGLPVSSRDNGPREDMPDLDPTFEFGPSLILRLWHDQTSTTTSVKLHLPLRAAYSIDDFTVEHQGWIVAPYLELTHRNTLNYSLAVGPIFADDAYHDYFYGVRPTYATATRPAYQGSSGYSGGRLTILAHKQLKNLSVAAFLRFDTLNGATFADSPLVETRHYHLVGFALTWILGRSEQLVYSR